MTVRDEALPVKGQRYRLRNGRHGVWTVHSCGPQWITLRSDVPYATAQRLRTDRFVELLGKASGWERA